MASSRPLRLCPPDLDTSDSETPYEPDVLIAAVADPEFALASCSGEPQPAAPNPDPEAKLHELTALLEESDDAILMLDAQRRISEWNPAAESLFGWRREEIVDAPIRQFVPLEYRGQFEQVWERLLAGESVPPYETVRYRRDGTRMTVSVVVAAVYKEGSFAGAAATMCDVSESRPAQPGSVDEPIRAAFLERDELTGLPGRRALQRRLAEPVPTGLARAVAVLDVDAFALVNQTYGPDAGDDVLDELSRRLRVAVGNAFLGRWQADEFVCIVDAEDAAAAMNSLTADVLRAVRAPLGLGQDVLYLTLSAGTSTAELVPEGDLLTAATYAMRAAKEAGRDRAVWFEPALRPASTGGLRLANDLHRGIERGELRLHYQPIVELGHNHLVGVEALVRWERPGAGLLTPADFIDVAERTGQIVPLGAWVTQQACRAAADLADLGSGPHSVSVNLSARQLSDPGLVEMLRAALDDAGCLPSSVTIEVTETAIMHDMTKATATLKAIKALGVSLDLDDFGTGYSSLLYLKHFPVDRIKIDRSFITGLGVDADDSAIVASTISLAHSVGMQAVAEGVETVDQLALLRQMGCDFAQGYLFSRPLTFEQLDLWLPDHLPSQQRDDGAAESVDRARILELHSEGASLHTIAAALNVEGLRTTRGIRWSAQSVAKVISRAQYPSIRLPR